MKRRLACCAAARSAAATAVENLGHLPGEFGRRRRECSDLEGANCWSCRSTTRWPSRGLTGGDLAAGAWLPWAARVMQAKEERDQRPRCVETVGCNGQAHYVRITSPYCRDVRFGGSLRRDRAHSRLGDCQPRASNRRSGVVSCRTASATPAKRARGRDDASSAIAGRRMSSTWSSAQQVRRM